jgi:hypothetical protein
MAITSAANGRRTAAAGAVGDATGCVVMVVVLQDR